MQFSFSVLVLVLLLLFSVYYDWTQKKIPNRITMPTILIGVIWSTLNSGLDGFLFSVLGFLIGFAVFLIPYFYGGIGAGDVKLMAAIGSLMGWRVVLASGLATSIAGGVLVIIYIIAKGNSINIIINTIGILIKPLLELFYMISGKDWFLEKQIYFVKSKTEKENEYIPYAIAIAAGTLSVLIFGLDSLIQF
ncbi:prepilin peptidase [Proteiniclasticum sp. C24MP]|uniref:A24 family peptidase n=1 Tax=Proteiniclasticum sp. C24MP TaxID=3374101 RepID=UPI0037550FCE